MRLESLGEKKNLRGREGTAAIGNLLPFLSSISRGLLIREIFRKRIREIFDLYYERVDKRRRKELEITIF